MDDELTLPLDELMALAVVTEEDIPEALAWWAAYASPTWEGVFDEA